MKGHFSDNIDLHPEDGWYKARCICGWTEGPFLDIELVFDSLMDHAYEQGYNAAAYELGFGK